MTIVLSMITKRRGVFTATATATMMFLAACSSGETGGSGDAASSASNGDAAASGEGTIEIVASTSVWGDLTKAVIDDESVANIRTIITDTNVDPHHFEPTAADLARANDADVVVAGGGGYDAWLYEPLDEDIVIHALPLTPHEHNSGSEKPEGTEAHAQYYGDNDTFDVANNEHVWFDTKALSTVANGVADRIKETHPDAPVKIDELNAELDAIAEQIKALPAVTVAQTHPIADYILTHTAMDEITPESYRHATLNHSDAAAADLASFLELIDNDELDVLIYNPQTETDLTKRIREAAEAKNIPMVPVGETPLDGENFLEYFHSVVDDLEEAAAKANA